ncbi:MAG: hypothetical protein ACLPY1_24575 [Terracidiphilus sp.]
METREISEEKAAQILTQHAAGVPDNTRWWMAIIFGIGLVMRVSLALVMLHSYGLDWATRPETYFIARSLAYHGIYADVFGPGSGPTAHTAPLLPIILAMIIRVAGIGFAGEFVQAVLAAAAASAAFALLPILSVRCQLGILPGVIGGLVGAAAPVNFWAQTAGVWDAPYTMLGITGLCVLLSSYWIQECFPLRGAVVLGLVAGVQCLMNPTILQILAGWYLVGILCFARQRWAFSRFMATVALMIVVCLSPWAYRNSRAFGKVIWTRSNFGLELHLSNNDHATANAGENTASPNFAHPLSNRNENRRYRRMGELAYQQVNKDEALLWIHDHPAGFAQLTAQRIFFFWFPSMVRWWQTTAEALVTLLAMGGLFSLLKRNLLAFWMFIVVPIFYSAVYLIIAGSARHRLPIEPILLLLGCCFLTSVWSTFKAKLAKDRQPLMAKSAARIAAPHKATARSAF